MTIKVRCQQCQSEFRTDDRFAGKVAKCPKCAQPLKIPTAKVKASVAAANTPRTSQPIAAGKSSSAKSRGTSKSGNGGLRRSKSTGNHDAAKILLNSFEGPIEPVLPTLGYRLASLIVALVMILLPLIYLCVVAAVGYGIYYHAVNHTTILETEVRGRGYFFVLLAYVAPIFCGAILLVFMIKPLFFGGESNTRIRSLRRESEPVLFAFIDKICELVGSPRPKRIDLNCEVNASASFRRGMLSMFGSDLVLTIGLPLVAGLNTRQFAGVLAHEFGHFTQGAGMRLTYIVRSISFWFLRVVYHRDRADQWLAETAGALDIRLSWVLYLAMLFVWITRGILWILMAIGNMVASVLLRQMEFDADRYETRLAGSSTFKQTALQLRFLGVATQAAFSDLREYYREGRLADNLPRLIQAKVDQLPDDLKKQIVESVSEDKTGLFDTHPCDSDRIASAMSENSEGVFKVELPASTLFSDFEAQSRATTWEFYLEQFDNKIEKSKLRPVNDILQRHEKKTASREATERYFQGNWSVATPLPLTSFIDYEETSPQETLTKLKESRIRMLALTDEVKGHYETINKSHGRLSETNYLRYCLRAKLKIEMKDKELKRNPDEWIKKRQFKAERELSKSTRAIEPFQKLAAERLTDALRLAKVPKVAARISKHVDSKLDPEKLLECLQLLGDPMEKLVKVLNLMSPAETLVEQLQAGTKEEQVYIVLEGLMKDLYPTLSEIRKTWMNYQYPYEHAERDLSLAKFLMPEVPMKDDLQTVFVAGSQVTEIAPELYSRLLSDLVTIAEAVETAVGIPRSKAPPQPERTKELSA